MEKERGKYGYRYPGRESERIKGRGKKGKEKMR